MGKLIKIDRKISKLQKLIVQGANSKKEEDNIKNIYKPLTP